MRNKPVVVRSNKAGAAGRSRRARSWPLGSMIFLMAAVFALAAGARTLAMAGDEIRLLTLDPGHFHAALVQKFMYPQVSPVVRVYGAEGADLQAHLERIKSFNNRAENPTHWEEKVYTGPDFLKRMLRDKEGNVVVIAGNNLRKTEYIDQSIRGGLNVLADKPMAINPGEFRLLLKDFVLAARNKVLLYDIMTERNEIATVLQRELARVPAVFGHLEPGTSEAPSVVMESVHHFFKEVAGKPLIRPAWSFDVRQQGEAIPDVGTHLLDLVQWECFPEQALNWKKDIKVLSARRWATPLTPVQFKKVTGLGGYPDFLKGDVASNDVLQVMENGEVSYTIRGIHAQVTALWRFEPPAGGKDTHYSMLRGTRATLTIKQGEAERFQPTLYVANTSGYSQGEFEGALRAAVEKLAATWPGIDIQSSGDQWKVLIPEKYNVGHEAHFAQVTEHFLGFLAQGKLPEWEVPNMISKYYTATEAYRIGHRH